jgi:flagellar biosynthesis regulator FlaF
VGNFSHLKEQAEGRKSRQKTLDAILELLTSDAISSEQMRESAMALFHFEGKLLSEIDRVSRSYDNPQERELRVALLLGIALKALEKVA